MFPSATRANVEKNALMLLLERSDQVTQETTCKRGDDAKPDPAGFHASGRVGMMWGYFDRLDGRNDLAEEALPLRSGEPRPMCTRNKETPTSSSNLPIRRLTVDTLVFSARAAAEKLIISATAST